MHLPFLSKSDNCIQDWPSFSNHGVNPNNQVKSNSLETIHDSIHVVTGGGGHMGDPSGEPICLNDHAGFVEAMLSSCWI